MDRQEKFIIDRIVCLGIWFGRLALRRSIYLPAKGKLRYFIEMNSQEPCPCSSELTYGDCCELVHNNLNAADDPESVMRARYSAYVLGNIPFLKASLIANERDNFDEDAAKEWAKDSNWIKLDVVASDPPKPNASTGQVEFQAYFEQGDETLVHHEIASFKKVEGCWYYVDGVMPAAETIVRSAPKVGRNDPCVCGSGKKYKKCCMNTAE